MTIDAAYARITAHVDTIERSIDHIYAQTLAGIHPHILHFAQALPDSDRLAWLHTGGHLGKLEGTLRNAIHAYAQRVMETMHTGIMDATRMASDAAQAMLAEGIPPQVVAWQMRGADVRQQVQAHLDRSQKLFNTFPAQTRDRLRTLLYSSNISGNGPLALARDIVNVLGMTRNRSLLIARTEMLGAYRDANLANFRANSDVVDGWIWSAGMGACGSCSFENGSEHDLSEDMSSHPNCRCSPKPKTKTYSEILGAYGIDF